MVVFEGEEGNQTRSSWGWVDVKELFPQPKTGKQAAGFAGQTGVGADSSLCWAGVGSSSVTAKGARHVIKT